jgi:hypothetical protein
MKSKKESKTFQGQSGTEDHHFESRQGVRLFRTEYNAMLLCFCFD